MDRSILIISLTLFIVSGCSSYPETPEKVVEKFTKYVSSGECEAALELCSGHALENVKISIESGCPPYTTQIDSVTCIIDQNHADCICYESRDQYPELSFPYELEKIDGQWKLIENTKSVSTEMD